MLKICFPGNLHRVMRWSGFGRYTETFMVWRESKITCFWNEKIIWCPPKSRCPVSFSTCLPVTHGKTEIMSVPPWGYENIDWHFLWQLCWPHWALGCEHWVIWDPGEGERERERERETSEQESVTEIHHFSLQGYNLTIVLTRMCSGESLQGNKNFVLVSVFLPVSSNKG